MTILSKFEFGVLRLSIDHQMKRNAINADMFDALTEALVQASQDESGPILNKCVQRPKS